MTKLANTPHAGIVGASDQGSTTPSLRILVVEDDDVIRKTNALVLARSGYHVDAAADGVAAWEALHAHTFDLLVTDHDMPRLTGVDLVSKMRIVRMTLPVILATGALPAEELERHPWLQISATLLKPFAPRQLLETVRAVLRVSDRAALSPEMCGSAPGNTFSDRLPCQPRDDHDNDITLE